MRLSIGLLAVFVVLSSSACERRDFAYWPRYYVCSSDSDCGTSDGCRAFIIDGEEVKLCTEACDPEMPIVYECIGSQDYTGPLQDAACESFDDEGRYDPDGQNFWCIKYRLCEGVGELVSLDGAPDGSSICIEHYGGSSVDSSDGPLE